VASNKMCDVPPFRQIPLCLTYVLIPHQLRMEDTGGLMKVGDPQLGMFYQCLVLMA